MSQLDFMEEFSSRSQSQSMSSTMGLVQFGFPSKTNYDANESLIQIRSENFEKKVVPKEEDIWKRPPPDFRRQNFAPKPPKRNSTDSMKPWLYGTIPGHREIIKRPNEKVVPHLLQSHTEEEKGLVTMFHIDRPFTAKKKFVREGMYSAGSYNNPSLHDYRGYPPIKTFGLPEFSSENDKDPYNINFHSDRLNTLHGGNLDKAVDRDTRGRQMAPPLPLAPSWERELILDKESWPIKKAQFTRFRLRNRPAHSAFMERASHLLNSRWEKEKMEKALRESGCYGQNS